jgi:hypothetical protein
VNKADGENAESQAANAGSWSSILNSCDSRVDHQAAGGRHQAGKKTKPPF